LRSKRQKTPKVRATTEQKLIDAVEGLMRSQGLARISTRDIAREAGLAEGTLYNHFRHKDEIFMAVLQRNVGELAHAIQDLPLRVGQGTLLDNLRSVAEAAAAFHIKAAPMFCSILADQTLLAETRHRMQERRIGPTRSLEALSAYVAAEQRLGRVSSEADADVVAALILGTSFYMAVLDHFSGNPPDERQSRARMRRAIEALVIGLTPGLRQGK
jgi:AcrR family transcriptional regulator